MNKIDVLLAEVEDDYLLVPNVVGFVKGAQRDLTLRVVVRDQSGNEIPGAVEIVEPEEEGGSRARWERNEAAEKSWLAEWGKRHGPDRLETCRKILDAIDGWAIPGLERSNLASGRPVFVMRNTILGDIKVLHVPTKAAIRDTLEKNKRWSSIPAAIAARERFRDVLSQMPGCWIAKHGQVYVPIEVLAQRLPALRDALTALQVALAGDVE